MTILRHFKEIIVEQSFISISIIISSNISIIIIVIAAAVIVEIQSPF